MGQREIIEELIRKEKEKGNVVMQVIDKIMSWLMPFN